MVPSIMASHSGPEAAKQPQTITLPPPCLTVGMNKGSSHICQKNILIIPKTFGQIFCGLMRQKFNFLEGVCPVTSGVKPTQHFIKRTSFFLVSTQQWLLPWNINMDAVFQQ